MIEVAKEKNKILAEVNDSLLNALKENFKWIKYLNPTIRTDADIQQWSKIKTKIEEAIKDAEQ